METEFVRRILPADVSALEECFAFVHQGALQSGLSEADMDRLDLIVEEFFMNVARHAYPSGTHGEIELGYAIPGAGRLQMEISDSGVKFNPLDVAQPELGGALADRPLGGMGIFLIKKIADSLTYQRIEDRNTICFTYSQLGSRSL